MISHPSCFNPCFSGTRARTHSAGRDRCLRGVSILVFLELAPGPVTGVVPVAATTVSILVFLELAPGLDHGHSLQLIVRFQSLFFWNSRPDLTPPLEMRRRTRCFNPCFSGTRARTAPFVITSTTKVSFQSLFFWNSRPDAIISASIMQSHRVSILVFLELAPGRHPW